MFLNFCMRRIADLLFSPADLLFVPILPLPDLRVERSGKGDQEEEDDENALLQPLQHSLKRFLGRVLTVHAGILTITPLFFKSGFFPERRPLLSFFLHRKSKLADMLPHAVVMAMAVAERFSSGQVEKSGFGIEIGRVGMNRQNLGDEHMVGSQFADLLDPAFQVDGRFVDERGFDEFSWHG